MGTVKALVLVCLLLLFIFSDMAFLLHALVTLIDVCAVMGIVYIIDFYVKKDD